MTYKIRKYGASKREFPISENTFPVFSGPMGLLWNSLGSKEAKNRAEGVLWKMHCSFPLLVPICIQIGKLSPVPDNHFYWKVDSLSIFRVEEEDEVSISCLGHFPDRSPKFFSRVAPGLYFRCLRSMKKSFPVAFLAFSRPFLAWPFPFQRNFLPRGPSGQTSLRHSPESSYNLEMV